MAARIRRDPEEGLNIIPGTTPVVFFGNQLGARVATLGINPSSAEFLDGATELDGSRRRFETLGSLGLDRLSSASDAQVEAIHDRCLNYFTDPATGQSPRTTAYWQWFQQLEDIIQPLTGKSYLDGTACHLDLVQWATSPVWGNLRGNAKPRLLAQDEDFLKAQVRAENLEILYLNGRSVVTQFVAVTPECQLKAVAKTRGAYTEDFFGGWFGGTRIIGTSINIQGTRIRGPRGDVQRWIVEELREIVERLDNDRPDSSG